MSPPPVSLMSRKTSKTARNSIYTCLCVGTALTWLLLGFVPQREGIEVRRRINPATATLRQDDVPAPIVATDGPWSIRAAVQSVVRHGIQDTQDAVALESSNTQEYSRWILFGEDGVRLRTFEGRQSLTTQAASEVFTPLLSLDNSLECIAERPAPAITSERILTALSGQSYGNTFDRARRYQALVEIFARRFGLNPALVYAIIYAESNFTPLLVSSRSAMGLMQLLPSTAGGEVHTFLHGRPASVSLNELSNPETNIRYGTAYLHLLLNRHLGEINDPLSREYCAVAAYNMGPNRFVRLYPPEVINAMTPAQVLEQLITNLPFSETRAFVAKVTRTREEFATSFGGM